MRTRRVIKPAVAFAAGGVAGWAIEAVATGAPRYSPAFQGAKVPFLPVYGTGAALISAVGPEMKGVPLIARGLIYATALTGLELTACQADRALLQSGQASWNYPGGAQSGCVDWKHGLIWGLLALAAEPFLT